MITAQTEALARIQCLVDDQDWRADKRAAWLPILRQLAHSMDWSTGLVTATTATTLAAAGHRSPRTVSRVIAWARDIGLLVVVEHAASAEFLGTDHGRTPTYALVTNQHHPTPPVTPPPTSTNTNQHTLVEENGDLSALALGIKPSRGTRPTTSAPTPANWPVYAVPDTPADRSAATLTLLKRTGLDPSGVSRVPLWRARALLHTWWTHGACIAGLLWAIDHHPDHPTLHRGDALRSARDPLAVLGHRLRPWKSRLHELPRPLIGIRGYHAPAADPVPERVDAPRRTLPVESGAVDYARTAARAALHEHLAELRRRRSMPR